MRYSIAVLVCVALVSTVKPTDVDWSWAHSQAEARQNAKVVSAVPKPKPPKVDKDADYWKVHRQAVDLGLPLVVWATYNNPTLEQALDGMLHYHANSDQVNRWGYKAGYAHLFVPQAKPNDPDFLLSVGEVAAKDCAQSILLDIVQTRGRSRLLDVIRQNRAMRRQRAADRLAGDSWSSSLELQPVQSSYSGELGGCSSGGRFRLFRRGRLFAFGGGG